MSKLDIILCVIIICFTTNYYSQNIPNKPYPIDWQDYFKCVNWIKDNLPADAIVYSRKPQFTYLMANRKSIMITPTYNWRAVRQELIDNNVSYILYDNFGWSGSTNLYLRPLLEGGKIRYKVLYRVDNFEVLKIINI